MRRLLIVRRRALATWTAMRRIAGALLFVGAQLLTACDNSGVRSVGYFKDGSGNRIKTFSLQRNLSAAEVEAHASALFAKSGQLSAAYYFDVGAPVPADGVTLAKSVFEVNRVLYETPGIYPWHYAYMIGLNGSAAFVDCSATPKHDLCRPRER